MNLTSDFNAATHGGRKSTTCAISVNKSVTTFFEGTRAIRVFMSTVHTLVANIDSACGRMANRESMTCNRGMY